MEGKFRPNRQRVTIQRRIERRNSVGEIVVSFETACQVWAEIGDGYLTARHFGECLPHWRMMVDGEVKEIVGVVDHKTKKSRLVELQIREIENTSPRRFYPWGFDGEQQGFGASIESEANTSNRDTDHVEY